MNSDLPATGTAALLELLNPFVPDDFIDGCWPHRHTGGRRREYSAAQLYRLHLLGLLTPVRSVNLLVKLLPEQPAWRKFAGLRRQTQVPGVRVLHEFRGRVGVAGLRQINAHLLAPLLAGYLWQPWSVGLIDATDLPAACGGFKKSTRQYSAAHAALGGRTLKTGQSRCFVGYKKHTLRLWRHHYLAGVQLLPLVSWVTPANVSEGGLLVPSLHYCQQQWDWCPPRVVADLGYWGAAAKRQCRERWRVAVPTKLRSDMKLVPPYVAWNQAACPQGQPLTWLGYDGRAGEHWFGVGAEPELCRCCWEAARCPRQFAYPPAQHETLLGRLPLASRLAQQILQRVRPWIEPAQSFEKNQLGLSAVFCNSRRFTWVMALLADAVVLLRARALLGRPVTRPLLTHLMPVQLALELGVEAAPPFLHGQTTNPQNPK
jgi:hypothetical protein